MIKNIKHSIILALLLVMVFSFTNCQKEEFSTNNETIGSGKVKRINLTEFISNVNKTNNYEKLSTLFDINIKNVSVSHSRLSSSDNPWIVTDEIIMITREDKTFYTFRLETQTVGTSFYNLLVVVDLDGNIENTKIFEYEPSNSWLEDPSQEFTGSLKVQVNDIFSISDLSDLFLTRGTNECAIGTRGEWECNMLNPHYPGHPDCDKATSWTYTTTIIYGQCPPELDPGIDNDDGIPVGPGSGGGGGGGSGDGDPDNDNDCQPTIDNPCDDDETSVIPPDVIEMNTHEKNCEELNKLTSPPAYAEPNPYTDDNNTVTNPLGLNTSPRLAITNAGSSLGNASETGFGLYNAGTFFDYGPYAHYVPADEQTHKVRFKPKTIQFGSVHTHPNNNSSNTWIPMFSLDDIYSVLSFRNLYSSIDVLNNSNPNGDALFTNILIAEQDGMTKT